MQTFDEHNKDLELNEDRLHKELILHVEGIKSSMKRKDWTRALEDSERLVEILKMVI
jgi:hypothetical protein